LTYSHIELTTNGCSDNTEYISLIIDTEPRPQSSSTLSQWRTHS